MSIVGTDGAALADDPEPVDLIGEGLESWIRQGRTPAERRRRRRAAAAFVLVRVKRWTVSAAAEAMGYTRRGLRLAVERARMALASWYAAWSGEAVAAVA